MPNRFMQPREEWRTPRTKISRRHYIPLRDGEHNSPTSTNPETPGKPHVPGLDFSGVNGNGKQLTLPRDLAFQLYLTLKDEWFHTKEFDAVE